MDDLGSGRSAIRLGDRAPSPRLRVRDRRCGCAIRSRCCTHPNHSFFGRQSPRATGSRGHESLGWKRALVLRDVCGPVRRKPRSRGRSLPDVWMPASRLAMRRPLRTLTVPPLRGHSAARALAARTAHAAIRAAAERRRVFLALVGGGRPRGSGRGRDLVHPRVAVVQEYAAMPSVCARRCADPCASLAVGWSESGCLWCS